MDGPTYLLAQRVAAPHALEEPSPKRVGGSAVLAENRPVSAISDDPLPKHPFGVVGC